MQTQGTKEVLLNRLLKAMQDVESKSREKQMKRKETLEIYVMLAYLHIFLQTCLTFSVPGKLKN